MSKRMWLAAVIAGFLMAIPMALMIVNLHILRPSWLAVDLSWGMIFLGMGMIGLGGLIAAPVPVRALVTVSKG
jgi:hypothetical protein